jgi:hypothetical protein
MQVDFLFKGGTFLPHSFDWPTEVIGSEASEVGDELYRMGYTPSQNVGDDSGLSYQLHEKDDPRSWVVVFQTASSYSVILVETWPDLIDLLGRLSPIVLAAQEDTSDG